MPVQSWTSSSLIRHFPLTPARPSRAMTLDAAIGERVSFQVVVRTEAGEPQSIRVEVDAFRGVDARVRRVGYVPVQHHNTPVLPDETDGIGHIPGYVPDPLFDEDSLLLPAGETHAFYVTVTVGRNADDFLCASLYCACQKTGYPMTLAELTTSLEDKGWGTEGHKRTGKAVKILKRSLHLKLGPPTPQMLISRFCSRLHLKPETERKTRDILSEIQEKELLDGRPGGIAAAAIYVASHLCGEKVSQKHLAEVAGVTDMTVRHQYKIITKELNIRVTPQ